jgi:tetratricopeptide (TPR) repeat protein
VIASRLDRLERDAREVLQTAAVIGRNFYIPVLERLSGLASLMLTLYLAELEEREYVSERQRDPDLEYVFRHPLLQEVAYNGLLKKRRRELHRKAGETIEGLYRDRLEEFTELLAYQYARGDDPEKAVDWLNRAGQRAVDRYAHDEAIAYYGQLASLLARDFPGRKAEQSAAQEAIGDAYSMKAENAPALEAYEAMGRAGGGDRLVQARSCEKIAGVYQKQSRYDESFEVLERAEKTLSGELPEEAMERAEIRFMRCWGYQAKGDLDRAIKEGEAGLNAIAALLRESPPGVDLRKARRIKAKGLNYMAVTYWNKAEHALAIEFNQDLLALSEEISDKLGMGTACGNLGILYHDLGDYSRAVPYYERSYAISQAIGDRQQMIRVCGNLGIVHYERGEYDRALELNQDYLRNTVEIGARQGEVSAHINLGLVYLDRGDWPRARECQMRALALAEEIGYPKGAGIASLNLGTLSLEAGDWAEAERFLQKAEAIMNEVQDKFTVVEVYSLLALLKCRTRGPAPLPDRQALAYLEKASALTREIGSKYTLPRIHSVYGTVYAAAGDYPRSEEEFKQAVAMYAGLAQPKNEADAWLEYARMLAQAEGKGAALEGRSPEAFGKAREIYQGLNLAYKVKECR